VLVMGVAWFGIEQMSTTSAPAEAPPAQSAN
jgi:hypothetical protein